MTGPLFIFNRHNGTIKQWTDTDNQDGSSPDSEYIGYPYIIGQQPCR